MTTSEKAAWAAMIGLAVIGGLLLVPMSLFVIIGLGLKVLQDERR